MEESKECKGGREGQKVNLVWRAMEEGLPTRTNLVCRGIKIDIMCPRCGDEPEITTHIYVTLMQ